jgi:hypothetical protein
LYEGAKTQPLSDVLKQDLCVTGIMKRLALVIYAYDKTLVSQLDNALQTSINDHLKQNEIIPQTYRENMPLSLIERLQLTRESFTAGSIDKLFCEWLIEKESKPQLTFLQRIQRR